MFIYNFNEKGLNKFEKDINESKECEVGEDKTKYGEFISSYFAWISLLNQKEKVEELENRLRKEYVKPELSVENVPSNYEEYLKNKGRW